MTAPAVLLAGWTVLTLAMAALWLVQRRSGDAGVVDAGWAAGIGLVAAGAAVLVEGPLERRLLVGAMAVAWSSRLALYILRDRVLAGPEDGRYQALRERWGASFQGRIFVFFQAQGLLSAAFAAPVVAAMAAPRPLDRWDAAALALWVVAVGGESLADRQLAAWRADPSNRGRTCRHGLWRLSRHPNYFFEWLHWWAYALAGVGAAWWWVTLVAPLVMLVFILFITGIPPTEARALASRGDDYRDYQRTTSPFVPWFPRRRPRP